MKLQRFLNLFEVGKGTPHAMAARGAFILFEGVDRCGKTTQAHRLVATLCGSGQPAVFMRFPDRETSIGGQINAYLTGAAEVDDRAIHLLFSANRWEKRCVLFFLPQRPTPAHSRPPSLSRARNPPSNCHLTHRQLRAAARAPRGHARGYGPIRLQRRCILLGKAGAGR